MSNTYYDQDAYDRQTTDEFVPLCEIDGTREDTYGAEIYWQCDEEAAWTVLYFDKKQDVCRRHAEGYEVIGGADWERDVHATAQEAFDAGA